MQIENYQANGKNDKENTKELPVLINKEVKNTLEKNEAMNIEINTERKEGD